MNRLRSHITIGHACWKRVIKQGDTVIDATCGNGHDTLCLARLALTADAGHVIAIDIQPEAIKTTQQRLQYHLRDCVYNRVEFSCQGHEEFPDIPKHSVKLIVYNLGYLPKSDGVTTTKTETTLKSISKALELVTFDGMISITCYPGHDEGKKESEAVLNYLNSIKSEYWQVTHMRYINRFLAPHLYLIKALKRYK